MLVYGVGVNGIKLVVLALAMANSWLKWNLDGSNFDRLKLNINYTEIIKISQFGSG